MSNDQNWITGRITEARKRHPSVTESVSARMEELLSDQFSERQLSKTELTSVAKELIASMVPTPSDAKQ
jgi:hypothetical protein